MGSSFTEYREVRGSEPLRQGDVLESVDPDAGIWCRSLFVITADCDLAFKKNHGRVTCVPLLQADEYLLEMQIPKLRERQAKKYLSDLRGILMSAGKPAITQDRLRAWIIEEGSASAIDALGLDGLDCSKAAKLAASLDLLFKPCESVASALGNLVEAEVSVHDKAPRTKVTSSIVSDLRQCFRQTPGDAMFLSAIGAGHDSGYFAYLRHIEQVREPEIALGPTRKAVSYRRISRLQDRFTHSLVQRFAMVFLSIGLPQEYEEMRDLHSEMIGDGTT